MMTNFLSALGAEFRDISVFVDAQPHGFLIKPLSISYSAFEEVLVLDADNNCTKDLEYLLDEPAYLKHCCNFWPDYWEYSSENKIWEKLQIKLLTNLEQESGQLLINKRKCWRELQLELAAHLNINADCIYLFMYGDKNTYQIAWSYLNSPYHFIHPPSTCGYESDDCKFHGITMSQYDPNGDIIFLHRNLQKWGVTPNHEKAWIINKSFNENVLEKACTIHQYKNGNYIDLEGNVDVVDFTETALVLEETCLKSLNKLRSFPFYKDELLNNYILTNQ